MNDLISRLKTKPLPIRRRIAAFTAGGVSALVGVVWLTASIALGTFGGSHADAPIASAPVTNGVSPTALVGAAAASQQPADAPADSGTANLQIVETHTSSTIASDPGSQTIIPF